MDKILMSADMDVTVTNDGATIMERMEVFHSSVMRRILTLILARQSRIHVS